MDSGDTVIDKIVKMHPYMDGLLVRRAQTGCILYEGKKRGRIEGNPSVYERTVYERTRKGKTILLRASVWNMFHEKKPKGTYIRMKCGNHSCHNPEHQYLATHHTQYRIRTRSKIWSLTPDEVNVIRYFIHMPPIVLERIFHITKKSIHRIQKREARRDVITPALFRPSKHWVDRIEKEAINVPMRIILEPRQIMQATLDINRCPMKERERDIILRVIKGEKVSKLAKEYHLPRQNIYDIKNYWDGTYLADPWPAGMD